MRLRAAENSASVILQRTAADSKSRRRRNELRGARLPERCAPAGVLYCSSHAVELAHRSIGWIHLLDRQALDPPPPQRNCKRANLRRGLGCDLTGLPSSNSRNFRGRAIRATSRSIGVPLDRRLSNSFAETAAPTHRLLVQLEKACGALANRAQEKRPFAAVGKAAVDNLDLAPEALVAIAENNMDRLCIAGHDARCAQPRDADGSKVVLKQSVP
jgi:hypothetical protein